MNLSAMKMISFEMSGHCNLAKKHPRCPVSLRKYVSKNRLTNEDILRVMDEAKALGFAGHFNFNYYNEPLMDLKRILSIISERKEKICTVDERVFARFPHRAKHLSFFV